MSSPSNKSTIQKGDALEDYVTYLYEGFGYAVQRDVLLDGQQVDLLVTRQLPGAGLVRIAVECKYLSNGKVSNQEVHDFVAFVAAAISRRVITKGVMVTNASYTRTAKSAAKDHIELLVLNELEDELFALKQFYRDAVLEYEAEAIFREYIALGAFTESSGSQIPDVRSWLMDLITLPAEPPPSIAVLADYGAGKTTLLRRLFHDVALAYVAGRMKPKPLYFELKYLNDQDNIDAFISSTLRRQIGTEVPMPLFWSEMRRGGFLVLLDGFDEMSPQVDRTIRMSNFLEISPLFHGGSTAILTCRPSYFINHKEYEATVASIRETNAQLGVHFKKSRYKRVNTTGKRVNVLYTALHGKYIGKYVVGEDYAAQCYESKALETIFLEPFSEQQIQEYLSRFDEDFLLHCKRDSKQVRDFLLTVYDLVDLIQKPILLSMIKDTILLKGEDFFNLLSDYGPATLYELYTGLSFDIDWAKGYPRRFLTREERRSFAQALAIAMYDNSTLEVSYEDILSIVNKHPRIMNALRARFESVTQEQVVADIQVCTFITRTPAETFRFVHKSYMEFFLASFLNERPSSRRLSARLLPKEIAYFLGSFARIGEPISDRIKYYLERFDLIWSPSTKKSSLIFRSNLYRVYLYSTGQISDRPFRVATLDEIDLRKVRFVNVSFSRISFSRNRWEICQFQKAEFDDCRIDDCVFADVIFQEVNITANVRGLRIQRGSIIDSQLNMSCDHTELEGTVVRDTKVNLSGTLYCRQSVFVDTEIRVACNEEGQLTIAGFSSCEMERVAITAKPHEGAIPQLELHDCKLGEVLLLGPLLSPEAFKNVKNTLRNCHGFAFIKASLTHETTTDSGINGELRESDQEELYWLSDTFVVIHLDAWREGKTLIPNQIIQSIVRLNILEEAINQCLLHWQRWIVK